VLQFTRTSPINYFETILESAGYVIDHLANVRIVLVGTSHPGNIGGAARAMKNMRLERLYLVDPKVFPHREATARSAGASDILANAIVCRSLVEALEGCTLVVATSARRRTLRWPQLAPKDCAQRILEHAVNNDVALVFGRERTGLSNAELDLCHFMTYIPCNPEFSSLNLAAAVQIMSYELMNATHGIFVPKDEEIHRSLADAGDVERFYQHLEQTLIALGFLDPRNPKHLMRRLRRMFNRIRLSQVEVSILRGILTAAQKHIT